MEARERATPKIEKRVDMLLLDSVAGFGVGVVCGKGGGRSIKEMEGSIKVSRALQCCSCCHAGCELGDIRNCITKMQTPKYCTKGTMVCSGEVCCGSAVCREGLGERGVKLRCVRVST